MVKTGGRTMDRRIDLNQAEAGLRRMIAAGYRVQCWYLDAVRDAARGEPDHPAARRVLGYVSRLRGRCSGV